MNKLVLKSAICAIFLVITTMTSAQNFYSYNDIVSGNALKNGNIGFDMERARSLVKDLHPKLYLKNGNVLQSSSPNSYYAEIDVASLSSLSSNTNANNFEIIRINVKSTNNFSVDLSQLRQSYTGLTFVYVVCDFQCDLNYIRQFFVNDDPNIMIIYSISVPI